MEFVEDTRKGDSIDVVPILSDEKSKYGALLKSSFLHPEKYSHFFGCDVFREYNILLGISKVSTMFNTEPKCRFLMHLICEHILIKIKNSVKISTAKINRKVLLDDTQKFSISITTVIQRYFDHSCAPTVDMVVVNNKCVFFTLRPIKSGEYLRQTQHEFLLEPTSKRQEILLQKGMSACKCERCDGPAASESQRKQLASDLDYIYITGKMTELEEEDLQTVNDKCVSFLTKYGRKIWCDEIVEIVNAYKIIRSLQWEEINILS